MSDKGTVSPKEKETAEKRGRGRPRKQPQVKTSDVSSASSYIYFFIFMGKVSLSGLHENTTDINTAIKCFCILRGDETSL